MDETQATGRLTPAYRARPACRVLYDGVAALAGMPGPDESRAAAIAVQEYLTGTGVGADSWPRLREVEPAGLPTAMARLVLEATDLGPPITPRSAATIVDDLAELLCVEFDVLAAVTDMLSDRLSDRLSDPLSDKGDTYPRAVEAGAGAAARTATTREHYRRLIRQQELVDVRLAQAYRRCAQSLHTAPDDRARSRAGASLAQGRLKAAHDQLGLDGVARQYDDHRTAAAIAHYERWSEHAGRLRWAAPYGDRAGLDLEQRTFGALAASTRRAAGETERLAAARRRGLEAAVAEARDGIAGRAAGPDVGQVDELIAHAERLTVRAREIAVLRAHGSYHPAPSLDAHGPAHDGGPAVAARAALDGVDGAGGAVRSAPGIRPAPADVGPPDPVVVSAAAREQRHG